MRVHLTDRNLRRALVVVLFIATLAVFRDLGFLLVFFTLFQRSLGFVAGHVRRVTKLPFAVAVICLVLLGLGAVATAGFLATRGVITNFAEIKDSAHELIQLVQNSALYQEYSGMLGNADSLIDRAKEHGKEIVHYVEVFGKNALYLIIALILAIVFLLERNELEHFRERIPMESIPRVILRFFGHLADAITITFRLQFVVAVANALFTLPVLLLIRMPGIPALMAMLVLSGLVPVVGGVVAGAVLMIIAYITKGYVGLGVFIVWTFILHKLESYVLTPRLTAQHVKLPSFVIVVSLILFEHLFGVVGLFLSFPFLFVTTRIREGWIDPADEAEQEERTSKAMRGYLPTLIGGHYIQR